MDDFAKLVGRFFAREFVYFLGGCFFLASILFVMKEDKFLDAITAANTIPTFLTLPAAGLAYVLGYLLNFIFGLWFNSPSDRLLPWSKTDHWRSSVARLVFFAINKYSLNEIVKFIDEKPEITRFDQVTPAMLFAFQALNRTQDYLSRGSTLHHGA